MHDSITIDRSTVQQVLLALEWDTLRTDAVITYEDAITALKNKLLLNAREIGPGIIDVRLDGLTYRSADKVEVQKAEPVSELQKRYLQSEKSFQQQAEPVYRKGCAECGRAKQVQEDDDEWKADLAKGREILARQSAPQQQAEPVMLNGLTEAETNAAASVMGLTKQADPDCEHCYGSGKTIVYGIAESWEENCLYCNGTGITQKANT